MEGADILDLKGFSTLNVGDISVRHASLQQISSDIEAQPSLCG
jgi:hypothetical protein